MGNMSAGQGTQYFQIGLWPLGFWRHLFAEVVEANRHAVSSGNSRLQTRHTRRERSVFQQQRHCAHSGAPRAVCRAFPSCPVVVELQRQGMLVEASGRPPAGLGDRMGCEQLGEVPGEHLHQHVSRLLLVKTGADESPAAPRSLPTS